MHQVRVHRGTKPSQDVLEGLHRCESIVWTVGCGQCFQEFSYARGLLVGCDCDAKKLSKTFEGPSLCFTFVAMM